MESRLASERLLLRALLGEMAFRVRESGADLTLLLLPGKSFVDQPESASALFQDHVRRFILQEAAGIGVVTVDVVGEFRERCRVSTTDCFHPNEGHYSAAGHAILGELLMAWKKERAALGRPEQYRKATP